MNKANECTCPSGDGSLRWPCPKHPAVDQAGGDERAADEKPRATRCPDCGEHDLMPGDLCACGYETDPATGYACSECDGSGDGCVGEVCRECDGSGWFVTPDQARAALAQPSPAQAEAERPEVVARVVHSNPVVLGQCGPLNANDELMTVAQHAASVARWAEMFNRVEQQRDAALARVAGLEAKLGKLEKQEPVAVVKGDGSLGAGFPSGTKLYAAPVAQAQQLKDLDKQCRDDVARALGLRPNQERGFAWSYLLASIKSCVKASGDSAKAQHSVPEGWMLVECGIWTQEQVDEMQKTVTRFRNSEFVDDRALAMAVADAGQCKAPEISLAELLAALPGKEGV
ncbi:hypothetical protein J5F35_00070 [Pseudomonas aeruginosa]|uniref:hypothetical protein n=1 Tax=Pseudomonas aeruginosa TaxID=287 RepID=UPI0018C5B6AF|nr:hypothetical protein [Pseudomonas aeruginosa]MBH9214093.1 hypothetical protein [Pseudomonas aeruginosa]MBP8491125.1 hypothetical protein [Pseudomonas aeruginosa]MBP8509244.1 hypothetical protein [Pseudomonas aeruginosa]